MARINQFTRTVLLDRSNPGNIEAAAAVGGGNEARAYEQKAQQSFRNAKIVGGFLDETMQQKQAEARVKAQTDANELQRARIKKQQEMQMERQGNPTGFAEEFNAWQQQQLADYEAKLGEDGSKTVDVEYLRQVVDRDRTQVFESNTNWESGQRVKNTVTSMEQNIDSMNVNFMMSNPSWGDFVRHQGQMRDYVNEVGGKVLSPQDQERLYGFAVDNAANSFFDEKLQSQPRVVKRVLDYGRGGKDAMIDFVMNDIEGGGKYVKDGDGYAKYGINSVANPSVDVKGLTPEAATEIYKTKYWDKKLDNFSPAFQAVAFDALVNHGNDKDTWQMIQQANGNPLALVSLRQKEYARLVAENPEKYAKNEAGWARRLETLTEFSDTLEGGGAEFLQNVSLVDPKIIANIKGRIPQAIKDQDISIEHQAKKVREADIVTKISNEDKLLTETVYNEGLSLNDRISEIRRNDLAGNITDNFATESIAYLNSKVEGKATVSADKKYEAFNRLSDELKQVRLNLGGTSEKGEEVTIDEKTLTEYQKFQGSVVKSLAAGEITEAEARIFTKDFSGAVMQAIEANQSPGGIGRIMPGVQDPYGYAFDYIDSALENAGQSKNLLLKKELVMKFHSFAANYESSGNSATDEKTLNIMLKQSMESVNQKNFAGIIPPDKSPNMYVQKVPQVKAEHVFKSVVDMEAANLPDGTPVMVGDQKGYARK